MTKATFNQKNPFSSKLEFQLKKKQANCYICNTALYGAEIGNFGKKFWNMVLEKAGENQLDR